MNEILELLVSDPWAFGTEHGVGPFSCRLVSLGGERGSGYAELLQPIVIDGVACRYVRLKPRWVGDSLRSVLDGREIPADFIFSSDMPDIKAPFEPFHSPWGAIGSVKLQRVGPTAT